MCESPLQLVFFHKHLFFSWSKLDPVHFGSREKLCIVWCTWVLIHNNARYEQCENCRISLTCGGESRTLADKMKRTLMTWERKFVRNISVPTYEWEYYWIKRNQYIYNKFESPVIVTVIRARTAEWLGRVVRSNGERTVQKLLGGISREERKKGRPGLRWMDDRCWTELEYGCKKWITRVLDRTERVSVLRESNAKLKVL